MNTRSGGVIGAWRRSRPGCLCKLHLRYSTTRISTKSFYTHHGQMPVKAAVVYDALAINKQILSQRQKLHHDSEKGVAHAAMPGEEDA